MKKILATIFATAMIASCYAQDGKIIRRIKIHSADPYFIALMLSGHANFNAQPEYSTIFKSDIGGRSGGGMGGGNFGSGAGGGQSGFGGQNGGFGSGSNGRGGFGG